MQQSSLSILLITDKPEQQQQTCQTLEFLGESVISATSTDWQEQGIDANTLLMIILGQVDASSVELINTLKAHYLTTPITSLGPLPAEQEQTTKHEVTELRLPLQQAQLLDVLHRCQVLLEQNLEDSDHSKAQKLFSTLVGRSTAIQEVRHLMSKVADSDVNVLILGESGTGKEVVAHGLHSQSSRSDKPFVPINCGAIPPDLLESELFGHEKGAFTGAISARKGRFELAEGGTLFLDEIGDMPLHMQVKLLRVLQERTFERVGGSKSIPTNVRIVAATHRNLEDLIQNGTFREDLFYRLNVFPIEMPPLRERTEDISLLINELSARIEAEQRASVKFTDAACKALAQYHWAGNIRELANLVERMAIMHPNGVIDTQDLPRKYRNLSAGAVHHIDHANNDAEERAIFADLNSLDINSETGIDLKEHIKDTEISLIKKALDECDGVVARAADYLNMRRTTLVEKMRKYGVQRTDES